MSDVGDVARAVEVIGKIVFAELHPSQQEQINDKFKESKERVNEYKKALLDDDVDLCRRLELGLMFGIEADFGPGEIEPLEREPATGFNKFNQLGWYQRAEGGRFATQVMEIIRTNTDTSHA